MIVNLLMGNFFNQASSQLLNLWNISKTYLIASTQIITALILLIALWKNRKKLKTAVQKLFEKNNDEHDV